MVDVATSQEAERMAGLEPGKVDTTIACGVGVIVHEHGMFEEPMRQHYFTIERKLFAGPAVLYSYDHENGVTVDFDEGKYLVQAFLSFFKSAALVEQAIADGAVDRPEIAINGMVIWRWPDPPPEGSGAVRT